MTEKDYKEKIQALELENERLKKIVRVHLKIINKFVDQIVSNPESKKHIRNCPTNTNAFDIPAMAKSSSSSDN